jgi:hypothetical protein
MNTKNGIQTNENHSLQKWKTCIDQEKDFLGCVYEDNTGRLLINLKL